MNTAKEKISIRYPSGKIREAERGITAREAVSDGEFHGYRHPVVAAMVNNYAISLDHRLEVNCDLDVVTLDSMEGARIYRRSLCFLLTLTSKQLFPDRRLVIGHSLGKGFFYYYDAVDRVTDGDLELLKRKMSEIAHQDLPIIQKIISYREAAEYFNRSGQTDTVLLLKYRNESKVFTNACSTFMDLYHGPLVPSTGLLNVFDIVNYPPGFLLRYFSTGNPDIIPDFEENPVLFSIYQEYKNWGKILNMHCVGALNELITNRRVKDFIQIAEALHNKKISMIADKIAEKRRTVKLILIAGPSSSGKTTFAKKLVIQLRVLGLNPVPISVDNYFKDRELTPRDEVGNFDLESIDALDLDLFNKHLLDLFAGAEIEVPHYDFASGKRKSSHTKLKLPENAILICEGIHCLNDRLTSQVSRENKYKIYISALTQLNIDDHNRISTTENRLIRRLVRDNQFRGYTAEDTLTMWYSVRRGEDKNIFPFQNTADSAFNSALDYELSVLKTYAEPLLKTVKPDMPVYNMAKNLLLFLNNFIPVPSSWVPADSILREFIGEGVFKY